MISRRLVFDYGNFNVVDFLTPHKRQEVIDKFTTFYMTNRVEEDAGLPSIVAHSHGTFVVGMAMLAQAALRFDKIILCASILPRSFDWDLLVQRNQVGLARNEYSPRDIWPMVASWIPGAEMGSSGRDGFENAPAATLTQLCNPYGKHGDAYSEANIVDQWLPFLNQRGTSYEIIYGRSISDFARYEHFFLQSGNIDIRQL